MITKASKVRILKKFGSSNTHTTVYNKIPYSGMQYDTYIEWYLC